MEFSVFIGFFHSQILIELSNFYICNPAEARKDIALPPSSWKFLLFYCWAFFFNGHVGAEAAQQLDAFFFGQLAAEAAQQPVLLVQAFWVIGQTLFGGHCLALEAQPVNPKEATQTTERRVRMDFIRTQP